MPFIKTQSNNGADDDRQGLLESNEPSHTPDNNLYDTQTTIVQRFVDDDDTDNNDLCFVPATLPELHNERHPTTIHEEDMQDIDLLISNAPPDRFRLTFFVFYLLGTATMTPWNFFVTAEEYWMFKFRNTTSNGSLPDDGSLTPLQKSFTCDLTLTASISGTAFLILNAIYGQRVPLKLKMLGTLTIILIIFIITTVFVEVNTDHWQEQFFLVTLFTVVIINICSATMSGAVFGVVGLFPAKYITALVSGQALGGIFTALTFLGVLAFGATPHTTAFIFFNIGSILILISILSYVLMSRQSFYQYYLDGGDKVSIRRESPTHEQNIDNGVSLEPNLREVFSKIYVDTISICLVFATTLSVYPAVTLLMQSQNMGNGNAWNDIYYLPVVNYLFFNCGDYFGRILAGLWEKPHDNAHTVLLMSIMRILFIPFFLCSNTNVHQFLPTIVSTDAAFITMMITFAITNGYLANVILIMAPRAVKQHEKEMASSIMAAALSCGLAVGSLLSMVFVQLL